MSTETKESDLDLRAEKVKELVSKLDSRSGDYRKALDAVRAKFKEDKLKLLSDYRKSIEELTSEYLSLQHEEKMADE